MNKILRSAVVALGLSAAGVTAASASTVQFEGEFWDASSGVGSLSTALSVMTNPATATFDSTAIDYPNGAGGSISDSTTLSAFLGADAGSLSGAAGSTLGGSVFRFTGFLDLGAGGHMFTVGSDDGFQLSLGGSVLSSFGGLRAYDETSAFSGLSGVQAFELIYFENAGDTGVTFNIDGELAQAALPAVPLPASGLLLLGAVGGFGALRRKRS